MFDSPPSKGVREWLQVALTIIWFVAAVVVVPWTRAISKKMTEFSETQAAQQQSLAILLERVPRNVALIISDHAQEPHGTTAQRLEDHDRRIKELEK